MALTGANILRLLLVFVPVAIYLGLTHASPTWDFLFCCLAILPLAGLMGEASAVSPLVIDGRTNWFEGVQLLAIYTILAMAFYFV